MTPTEHVIPGFELPADELIVYAKDQPQYHPLPMWKGPDGLRVSRWKLSWRERLKILTGGSLWLTILTFGNPLQPVKLEVDCPIMGSAMLDKEI